MTDEKTPSQDAVAATETKPGGIMDRSIAANRGEMSAQALGRMLGLATVSDMNILEGKIDLLASKINQLIVKMEKILGLTMKAPTGADLERIDIQIGSLKAAMLEFVSKHSLEQEEPLQKSPLQRSPLDDQEAVSAEGDEKTETLSKKRVTLSSINS